LETWKSWDLFSNEMIQELKKVFLESFDNQKFKSLDSIETKKQEEMKEDVTNNVPVLGLGKFKPLEIIKESISSREPLGFTSRPISLIRKKRNPLASDSDESDQEMIQKPFKPFKKTSLVMKPIRTFNTTSFPKESMMDSSTIPMGMVPHSEQKQKKDMDENDRIQRLLNTDLNEPLVDTDPELDGRPWNGYQESIESITSDHYVSTPNEDDTNESESEHESIISIDQQSINTPTSEELPASIDKEPDIFPNSSISIVTEPENNEMDIRPDSTSNSDIDMFA
jgi:hypothetical protein